MRLSLDAVTDHSTRSTEVGRSLPQGRLGGGDVSPYQSEVHKGRSGRRWAPFAAAGLLVGIGYGLQVFFCANSALFYMPYKFEATDMHANLLWAKSIVEQGWLNPCPHHPYTTWMRNIGTYQEWTSWWQNEAIYQHSPLYAYILACFQLVTDDLLYVHLLQAVLGIALCAALGRIAFRLDDRPLTGWIGFTIAALYAPFYAYSSALLRDVLGWAITAWLLVVLLELDRHSNPSRQRLLAAGAGLLLGLGFLARETYALILPVVIGVLAWRFVRAKAVSAAVVFGGSLLLVLAPLVIRNWAVGAPLLSTSNRFCDAVICGNAGSAQPVVFTIPTEARVILERSGGRTLPLIRETLRTHTSPIHWVRLQISKALSLLDPFESHDNMTMAFAGYISPLVKWGLRHWMVITPGIAGLLMSILLRDRRHFWLWALLPILLAGVLFGPPLSRYRQTLVLLWIPWAAYLVMNLLSRQRTGPLLRAGLALFVISGWLLSLGPLAKVPVSFYDRPVEYEIAMWIYDQSGQSRKADQMMEILRTKFAGHQLSRFSVERLQRNQPKRQNATAESEMTHPN